MDSGDVLSKLSETIGVSGYEHTVRNKIWNMLKECLDLEIYTDKIGNLICHKNGNSSTPKVLVVAHMDEVGFQVMKICDRKAYFKTLGNIKTWNALNQRIITADGKKAGIMCCEDPEGLKPYEFEKLAAISTKGQFEIGDVFGFDVKLIDTENQWIGKALDNRISCFVMYELLKKKLTPKSDTYFAFTAQEETGMRGARVAITSLMPDIIIDVDVSPVGDRNSINMGAGVGIKISDSIGISDHTLVEQFRQRSKNEGINYQMEVSDCGTSELIITNEKDSGAQRIGISIPCQNMHTAITTVDKKDVLACERLLETILTNGIY